MNETVCDIVSEMRNKEDMPLDGYSQIEAYQMIQSLADRIEAAYWRDMNTVADELARLKKQVSELCHFGVCRNEKCSCCENATKEIKE